MPKIKTLTDAQRSRFGEYVRKWTDIGLCTDPADRPRAEAGIRKAYECAGLAPPKLVVWCGSPLSMGLARAIVMGLGKSEVKIGDAVKQQVRDSVGASVRASVRDSVWASVRASVRDSVGDSVWDSVGDSVGASVWASVRDSVGDSVWDACYGQHDANWLAFYDYFRLATALDEQTQKLAGMWEVAKSANWWLPHQNICWVSERHGTLNRDDRGRLNCEDGPALAYPDGWCIWSIRGVRVDERIVMQPEAQTIEEIEGEQNAEIRRIRIERYGWGKYIIATGANVLDAVDDADGIHQALLKTRKGECLLCCACPSTGRTYTLEVDVRCCTVEQAQRYLLAPEAALAGIVSVSRVAKIKPIPVCQS